MVFETLGAEPLGAMLRLRLTASEKERLREDADLAGLSMSELVRRRYFGRPIIANADAIIANLVAGYGVPEADPQQGPLVALWYRFVF